MTEALEESPSRKVLGFYSTSHQFPQEKYILQANPYFSGFSFMAFQTKVETLLEGKMGPRHVDSQKQ